MNRFDKDPIKAHIYPGVKLNEPDPTYPARSQTFLDIIKLRVRLFGDQYELGQKLKDPAEIQKNIHELLATQKCTPIERWVTYGNMVSMFYSKEMSYKGLALEVNTDTQVHEVLEAGKDLIQPELALLQSRYDSSVITEWPYPNLGRDFRRSEGYCVPLVYNKSHGVSVLGNHDWITSAYVFGIGFLELDFRESHYLNAGRISTNFRGRNFPLPVMSVKYVPDDGRFRPIE